MEETRNEYPKAKNVLQVRNADSYTNDILDKIRAAGIEVVTDKDEFDRILQQKEKLQKMSTSFSKIDFGTVEQWQIEEAKDIGLDLSDYKHQLTSEFITHVIKHHGNQITEASRGNVAITKDDLKSINEIITSADRVVYGVTRKEIVAGQLIDRQRIIYAKNQTDGTSLYFEEVLEGKKNKRLRGKTFFKRNGSIDDNTLLLILGNNKKRDNIEKAIIKAHPDVAVSSLSQHQNVDVAAVSTVSELNKSISDFVDKSITDYVNSKIQTYIVNSQIYGFVHKGKIYLNPEIMNSNAAVHEYTHLWDAYTQKTNPELWDKGLDLFRNTKYWDEVISDPNYQDIKDDENLVLSEIHSRICGDIAEKVLEQIAQLDGEQVKLDAIDWNKETWNYIQENFYDVQLIGNDLSKFLSTPMKDLMSEKNIILETKLDIESQNKFSENQNKHTGEKNMEKTRNEYPNAKDVLDNLEKKDFTGYWIPAYNANLILKGLQNGNSPLAPDEDGKVTCVPIYNANTGFMVEGNKLIPLQIKKIESGYESNVVGTTKSIVAAGTQKKSGEKGVWFNFKDKNSSEIHQAQFIFPEQMEKPEKFIEYSNKLEHKGKEKNWNGLADKKYLADKTLVIDRGGKYLAAYFANGYQGLNVMATKKAFDEFVKEITPILENEKKGMEKDKKIMSLNDYVFNAEKEKNEIIKSFNSDRQVKNKIQKRENEGYTL